MLIVIKFYEHVTGILDSDGDGEAGENCGLSVTINLLT